jgi:predicted RND superfamily exporter protein
MISQLCLRHPGKILLTFIAVLGMAFVLTGRLRFDPDFLKLFPAERGPVKLYMESLKEAGTFDLVFVLLEKEEGIDSQRLIESGRRMADNLNGLEIDGKKAFKSIRFQKIEEEDLEGAKPAFALFLASPYLFLDEDDIPRLKEKWEEEEEIGKQVRKNRRVLLSHTSFAMKDLIQIDPFELRWLFMEKWKAGMKGMEFDESSNFFLSKDQRFLLILTEPARPATDLSFSTSLMEAMEKAASFAHADQSHGMKVSFTGAHPIAMSEAKTLRFDMQSSFLSSLILVLILFFLVYRRWMTFLFAGLPLFGGIQLTMGMASLVLGSLNILTSAFAAILVGLGIDFSIHLYDRYHHERALGADISSAVETTLTQTGEGIWTGAFTTIFAFAILYFSRVRGIVELAFLVSVGLLCLLLCTYFVLPSFLIWVDRRERPYAYPPLKTLGLGNLSSILERKTSLLFFGFIGLTFFFVFFAYRIEVEKEFRNLRPKEIPSLEVLERMSKAFGGRKMEAMAMHEGKNLNTLLLKEEMWANLLDRYRREKQVESFTSLSNLVPSYEKQERIAKMIRESIDLGRVKKSFTKALKENGFELREFQSFLEGLEDLRQGREKIYPPETLLTVLDQGLFRRGIERLLTKRGNTYRMVSYLYYQKGNLSLDHLEKDLKDISITGPERVELEIMRIVKEDLFLLTPIAFFLILFLVFLHFRKWETTLLTLTPLAMGMIWMIGAMSFFGIRINFVNAVVLPMIIGMGIDNGVHLMHRYLEGGKKDMGHALKTTGRAMVMCSFTTMFGFGSLVTARYQALSTMGWMTILGIGFCLVASLCFLPSLLLIRGKKDDRD